MSINDRLKHWWLSAQRDEDALRVEGRGVPNPVPARERAIARGWHVDPELSPGHPHEGECNCKAKKTTGFLRWCPCSCHGFSQGRYE